MKYSESIIIDLPRDRATALFDDPDNLPKWQEGLLEFTHFEGEFGAPGAKSRIRFQMGKRGLEVIETIVERDLPEKFSAIYEAKGVWNLNENWFEDLAGSRTQWRIDTEFRCSGMMRVMTLLMPWMFRRQTRKMMQDFKTFAEAAPS